jgi:hypothetical protein
VASTVAAASTAHRADSMVVVVRGVVVGIASLVSV